MSVLTHERATVVERWTRKQFALAVGNKAWKGGKAVLDLSTGKVEPGHAETDLLDIGRFAETVDATSVEKLVDVHFNREIQLERWANSGTNPMLAADIGSLCYIEDDQTVTKSPTSASIAGRVWDVDVSLGVAVERLAAVPAAVASLDGLGAVEAALDAFASNDTVVDDSPNSGTIYDVPTTGAASTVTLPATADEGTILYFVADGTKNGHTVTYRDATGPAALTTALTASKRHMVIATFLNGKWFANAYVSP